MWICAPLTGRLTSGLLDTNFQLVLTIPAQIYKRNREIEKLTGTMDMSQCHQLTWSQHDEQKIVGNMIFHAKIEWMAVHIKSFV